jgi:hypothetical protein
MSEINSFVDKYAFLSNFYGITIWIGGTPWLTAEHLFQACKTTDPAEREWVRMSETAGVAKRRGRQITLRSDWNEIKLDVMRYCLQKKFAHPMLAIHLKDTGDAILIEGNTWGDRYWGVCGGKGENMLGKLLMEVRDTLN